ncbi:MAG TPA: molybdenum cofactor guanylyltransferase [Trebonia sp.]|jgi:molybdopterin-guanine dinucleotide biosynthesis protein A|nr:molybdenum cofactor guanylyltransferase [Trebonia sp.]
MAGAAGVALAGVVLAGGRSSRMGAPKAALEWHGSTLLRRTVGIVARATEGPVIVVRASGQPLPELPPGIVVVDDPRPGKGPLQGIAAGLAAVADLSNRADPAGRGGLADFDAAGGCPEFAFVSSTDLPFLHPAFIRLVLRLLREDGADVALPVARGFRQPLAAGYRVSLAPSVDRLVAADRLRPAFLFDECAVSLLDEARLRRDPALAAVDPDLDSVVNVNEPADYQAARSRPAPVVTVRVLSPAPRPDPPVTVRAVRAATVQAAAAAVGLTLGRDVTVALNGRPAGQDGGLPLATGDAVAFSPSAGSQGSPS